jgi:hypothetical protein
LALLHGNSDKAEELHIEALETMYDDRESAVPAIVKITL